MDPHPIRIESFCPHCEKERVLEVLRGREGSRGGYHLQGVARCCTCLTIFPFEHHDPPDVELAAIVSRGSKSRRVLLQIPKDDILRVGEERRVEGRLVVIRSLETRKGKRVRWGRPLDLSTVWVEDIEEVVVKFTVHLRGKTISRTLLLPPEEEVSVGKSYSLGNLRVVVHAIKTEDRLRRSGSAWAREVVRAFAFPEVDERSVEARRQRNARRIREGKFSPWRTGRGEFL